jgi:hypothetical protein
LNPGFSFVRPLALSQYWATSPTFSRLRYTCNTYRNTHLKYDIESQRPVMTFPKVLSWQFSTRLSGKITSQQPQEMLQATSTCKLGALLC